MCYVFPSICSAWSIPSRAWSHTQHIHTHDYIYFADPYILRANIFGKKGWNPPFQQDRITKDPKTSLLFTQMLNSIRWCYIKFVANMCSKSCSSQSSSLKTFTSNSYSKEGRLSAETPQKPQPMVHIPWNPSQGVYTCQKKVLKPQMMLFQTSDFRWKHAVLCRFCLPKN